MDVGAVWLLLVKVFVSEKSIRFFLRGDWFLRIFVRSKVLVKTG